jgi:primosomal protein N' (replication factor Y)
MKNRDDQLELFANARAPRKRKPAAEPLPAQPPKFTHLAEVAVEGPVSGTFTYVADAFWERLKPGMRVLVPFGHRALPGFFLGERPWAELAQEKVDPGKLKPILRVLEDFAGGSLLTEKFLALARWMARRYACPLGSTLAAMLPAGVKHGAAPATVRLVSAVVPVDELARQAGLLAQSKPKQAALLLALASLAEPDTQGGGEISAAELLHEAQAPGSALKALEKAGLVRCREVRAENLREDFAHTEVHPGQELQLNDEQQLALDAIEAALCEPQDAPLGGHNRLMGFLLQGVTGSGKTEVYLRALKTALAQGKQGLVLVPEIALTPQTAQRFEQRFGCGRVAVLHSHQTTGERAEAWREVRAGKIDVVIGARSALFAPLPRLGLIVIDEEHENAFKQETTPRYHARETAFELARLSGAVLVLGSATPSFEALHAAKTGVLVHLFLTRRVAGRPLPPVEVVDMGQENTDVQRYVYLSGRLVRGLQETLARGEQAILFMNRRGFATVITCGHCGFTEKCSQCDITLTSHRAEDGPPRGLAGGMPSAHFTEQLTCHYCNTSKPMPKVCGNCGAPGIKHWGLGTERVENEVRKAFPEARVARMDSDTMKQRTSYLETLGKFRAGLIDILIGTQMIAKGLDFPNVTLVGVVLADTALHIPDFRSRERTFQLLAQVAGRAGRRAKGGRVIVQTHLPGDPAIKAASEHDYESFALKDLQERRAFAYPPYTRLARVIIRGKDQKETFLAAQAAAEILRAAVLAHTAITVLGPAEAPLSKLEGYYRRHILLKAGAGESLAELLAGPAGEALAKLRKVQVVVDVDPLAMM